jgi:hypothetical protein
VSVCVCVCERERERERERVEKYCLKYRKLYFHTIPVSIEVCMQIYVWLS